jgi:hypothetical protein
LEITVETDSLEAGLVVTLVGAAAAQALQQLTRHKHRHQPVVQD